MSTLRVALVLLVLCTSAWASAQELRGLPPLDVAALATAGDRLYVGGFDDGLYVVEPSGAARRLKNPALFQHVNALAWSEAEQTLWVGTARGLTRCRMHPSVACRRLGPSSAVHTLYLRSDGETVAGGDAGLTFVHGDSTEVFGKKQGAPFRSVWALGERDGALFVGATNGLFWGNRAHFATGASKLSRAAIVLGTLPDDWVTALLWQGDQLQVGTYNAGVASFRWHDARLVPGAVQAAYGYVNPNGIVALDDARFAVTSMDGLWSSAQEPQRLLASHEDTTAVAKASGGGYWIGTRHGLRWSKLGAATSRRAP